MLLGDLLRQLFPATQRGTDSRFRQRGNHIHGTFLPVRGILLVLAITAILGQKLPCTLAGAQPIHSHKSQVQGLCPISFIFLALNYTESCQLYLDLASFFDCSGGIIMIDTFIFSYQHWAYRLYDLSRNKAQNDYEHS